MGYLPLAWKFLKEVAKILSQPSIHVKEIVEKQRQSWPSQIKVTYSQDRSQDIREMMLDLTNNLISAIVLVMIVIIGSLGVRSGLIVGLSVPGSFLIGIFASIWLALLSISWCFSASSWQRVCSSMGNCGRGICRSQMLEGHHDWKPIPKGRNAWLGRCFPPSLLSSRPFCPCSFGPYCRRIYALSANYLDLRAYRFANHGLIIHPMYRRAYRKARNRSRCPFA